MMLRKVLAMVTGVVMSLSCGNAIICNAAANNDEATTVWGDSNCNGEVEMADAIYILQYCCNPTKYRISDQGLVNADVEKMGNGIDTEDAHAVQLYLADLVPKLPVSYKPHEMPETVVTTVTTTSIATTTTTTKPVTTTTTATTTTIKSTTTSTTTTSTSTTTSTKPTTTSTTTTSTSTTTTTKPTTTSTTTTSTSTTTTTKPTTTSTTTTSTSTTTTMKPTTTSTTTTSTTTTTTTKPTTTSTTATSTTTSTTTGKKSNWIPPQPEELVHDGEQISDDTYKILLNTAKTFGIDMYKIIWSDEPIEYAYTDPGMYECMCNGIAYGYGVQIATAHYVYTAKGWDYESFGNIEILCPTWSDLNKCGWEQNQYFWFRPMCEDDNNPEVLANEDTGYGSVVKDNDSGLMLCEISDIDEDPMELFPADIYDYNNTFQFANWYLIPVDAEGNEILELNKKESYDITKTEVETKYWLSEEELSCRTMNRVNYKTAIETAEYYGWTDFTVVDSEEAIPYAYAIGSPSWYNIKYYGQIIPFEDVNQFDDSFVSENLDYLLFPREALLTIEGEVVGTEGYEVFGGSTNIDLTGTYLIPLDLEGNQILELLTR